jgi:DUF4097 and DUF4098 domain-containing protein YvlB
MASTILLLAGASLPSRADFDERLSLKAETLVLRNLIGEISLEGHSGDGFEVEIMARGRDANRDNLKVETREGARAEVTIQFPLDRETRYVYPRMGPGSRTQFNLEPGGSVLLGVVSGVFGFGSSTMIRVAGSGTGMELWADVRIRVPRGSRAQIHHGVGALLSRDVEADLALGIRSGKVEAYATHGDLDVDTGSGKAVVEDASGTVHVDSGSGHVQLARLKGDRIAVDTGSGRISADTIRAKSLTMDTGSGGVSGSGLSADDATVDSGSGSVKLQFDRVGHGRFQIDTGSGSIQLELPTDASATIHAQTGNGALRVDSPGAETRRLDRNEAEVTLGGGAARFQLKTGSGSIQIQQR